MDPALPELAQLTDLAHPERMVALLGAAGSNESDPRAVEPVRVRYLMHDPGRFFLIHLQVGTARHDVVASRTVDVAGVRIAWFPTDLALPLLADPARLARLLQLDTTGPAELLAWTPQHRAVLRVGDVVVKLFPTPAEAAVSRDRLVTVSRLLPSARLVRAAVAAGAVAQTALAGAPLTRVDALPHARAAAAVARTLHESGVVESGVVEGASSLGEHRPDTMLAACAPVTRLVSFALPELAGRVGTLESGLRDSAPKANKLLLSHGDFTWGQLLRRTDGELALLDTDTLCHAPAAFDLASYAANLVSGRDADLPLTLRVLDEVVAGYGCLPADLPWWLSASLLRRLDRAVRRLKRDWPQRTEALLVAAEQTAPR